MAEMTVAEAIKLLNVYIISEFLLTCEQARQIAAIIEQQAAEIAKKNRMLKLACDRLEMLSADDENGYGKETWLAWLEKEAEGVE